MPWQKTWTYIVFMNIIIKGYIDKKNKQIYSRDKETTNES